MEQFEEIYDLGETLGKGALSIVREGICNSTGNVYAVKCIDPQKLSTKEEEALVNEVELLSELRHGGIMQLIKYYPEPNQYYLVMERVYGGELFDRIIDKGRYTETEASATCKQILAAIQYCHSKQIVHRDLKPDNILLQSKEDDTQIKLIDFGFAKKITKTPKEGSLTTLCGTLGYMAPEILQRRPYDERADMFSIGVILYILLSGEPPFYHPNGREIFRKNRFAEYTMDYDDNDNDNDNDNDLSESDDTTRANIWRNITPAGKDLIRKLLSVDPTERYTASEAIKYVWIAGECPVLCRLMEQREGMIAKFRERRNRLKQYQATSRKKCFLCDNLKNMRKGPCAKKCYIKETIAKLSPDSLWSAIMRRTGGSKKSTPTTTSTTIPTVEEQSTVTTTTTTTTTILATDTDSKEDNNDDRNGNNTKAEI